jgi:hypothetical protein
LALIRPEETPAPRAKKAGRNRTDLTHHRLLTGASAFIVKSISAMRPREQRNSVLMDPEQGTNLPHGVVSLGQRPSRFEGSSTSSPGSSDSTHTLENLTFPVTIANPAPRPPGRARYDKSIGFGSLAVARRLKASTAIEP